MGHIGEVQREGELVATALYLDITSLPAHSAQFGNGVEGKLTCEEGKHRSVKLVGDSGLRGSCMTFPLGGLHNLSL